MMHPILNLNGICSRKPFGSPSLKPWARHSFSPCLNSLWMTYHQLILPTNHTVPLIKHLLSNCTHWYNFINHIRAIVTCDCAMEMSSTNPSYCWSTQRCNDFRMRRGIHAKYDYKCFIQGNWKRLTVTSPTYNQTSYFRNIPCIFHVFIVVV